MYFAEVEASTGNFMWSTAYEVTTTTDVIIPMNLVINDEATFLYAIGTVRVITQLG